MATNHVFDTPLVEEDVPRDLAMFGYVTIDTVSEAMHNVSSNLGYIDADQPVPGLTKAQVATLVGLLNRMQLGVAREFGEV